MGMTAGRRRTVERRSDRGPGLVETIPGSAITIARKGARMRIQSEYRLPVDAEYSRSLRVAGCLHRQ